MLKHFFYAVLIVFGEAFALEYAGHFSWDLQDVITTPAIIIKIKN